MSRRGVLGVVLPGREQMNYLGERFVWGTSGRGELYKLTIKNTLSNKTFKDFPYTLRVPCNDFFNSIESHKKGLFMSTSAKIFLKK